MDFLREIAEVLAEVFEINVTEEKRPSTCRKRMLHERREGLTVNFRDCYSLIQCHFA